MRGLFLFPGLWRADRASGRGGEAGGDKKLAKGRNDNAPDVPGRWCVRGCRNGPPRLNNTEEQRRERELPAGSGLSYRLRLRSLGAWDDVELDPLAFIQGPKTPAFNRRVVDEDVRATILGDEPIPFFCVKPLHGALCHSMILLIWRERMCRNA